MNIITNPREAAVDSLYRTQTEKRYANLELDSLLSREGLSDADRALYTAIFYGVIERRITLDYIITKLSTRSVGDIDIRAAAAIRVGLYQMAFMDRIPVHAAVNESVNAAPEKARPFVNAILRAYLRKPVTLPDGNSPRALSIRYSVPEWLCSMWRNDYGSAADGLLAASFEKPSVCLRVNSLKTDEKAVCGKLTAHSLAANISAVDGDVVEIHGSAPVAKTPLAEMLADGEVFVQDAASRLCVRAADAHPGMTVLDVCAAPGGKTFSAAIDMNNTGAITAADIHANKLGLIQSGAERLGISIVSTVEADARTKAFDGGNFDRVICDVPCSGLGVISKKPDIRYKSQESVERLPAVQSSILSASKGAVAVGGLLVYSTCTLRRAENDAVADRFLAENDGFEPCDFSLAGFSSYSGKLTLMPQYSHTDGFFIARFRRVK